MSQTRAGSFLQTFNELGLDSPHVYTTAFQRGKLVIQGTYVHPKYPQIVHTTYQTPWSEQQAKATGVYTGSEVSMRGNQAVLRSVTNNKSVAIPLEGSPQTQVQEVPKPQSDYPDQVKWINGAWRRHTPNGWVKDIAIPVGMAALGTAASALATHGMHKVLKTGPFKESIDEGKGRYVARFQDGKLELMKHQVDLNQPMRVHTIYRTDMTPQEAQQRGIPPDTHFDVKDGVATATASSGGAVRLRLPEPEFVRTAIKKPKVDDEGNPLRPEDAASLIWDNGEWKSENDIEEPEAPEAPPTWKDQLAEPIGAGAEELVKRAGSHFARSSFSPALRPGNHRVELDGGDDGGDDGDEENESRSDWCGLSALTLLQRYDEADVDDKETVIK